MTYRIVGSFDCGVMNWESMQVRVAQCTECDDVYLSSHFVVQWNPFNADTLGTHSECPV